MDKNDNTGKTPQVDAPALTQEQMAAERKRLEADRILYWGSI